MVDKLGRPTGVERMSFRLNIHDGRTESIDEDMSHVLRQNGLSDGTNFRRVVEEVVEYGGEK